MTVLDCSVVNCLYNQDDSCKRKDIMVEGHNAHVSSETSCGSFKSRGCGCSAQDSACNSKKDTEVACQAVECMFNRSAQCSAKHIGIAGGHADNSSETECGSFVCQ